MEPLGERLGEPVGHGAHHDRAVVVVVGLEPRRELAGAVDADRERTDVILEPALDRGDVVRERRVGTRVAVRALLAQLREALAVEDDVVAVGVCGPEAVDAARAEQAVLDDLVEQLVRAVEQVARRLALLGIVEDRRIATAELPGVEEERPVDVAAQLADRCLDRPAYR